MASVYIGDNEMNKDEPKPNEKTPEEIEIEGLMTDLGGSE